MANDNVARQLSCSWGGGSADAAAEQIFQQMAAQGQSFFNAAGDSDAFTGAIPFPSDSPNITQVGGTTLTTGAGGSYSSETVWNWGRGTGSSGGNNTWGRSRTKFSAVAGYDLCTGLGTPSGTNLINVLAPIPTPLVATFGGAPTTGAAPLSVTFSDNSSGAINNRYWDFGNGVTT